MNERPRDLPSEAQKLHACPICGQRDFQPMVMPAIRIGDEHFKDLLPHLALVKCLHCGLIYVNPRPMPDDLMTFYERPGYVHHAQGYGRTYDYGRVDFVSRFAKGSRLLDVGCGGGTFLTVARDRGYLVAGMEPSSQGRLSSTRAGLEVFENVADLVSNQRKFDVVTIWHVLEHVPDMSTFLQNLRCLLAQNGVMIVAVPNAYSARASLLRTFPGLRPPDDDAYRAFPIHLYAFARRNLALLLKNCGFSVVFSTTHYLAVNECFWKRKTTAPFSKEQSGQTSAVPPTGERGGISWWRWLFQPLKKAFFGAYLGESLVMVAMSAEERDTAQRA